VNYNLVNMGTTSFHCTRSS